VKVTPSDGFLHRVGVFRREAFSSLGKDRLALFLAGPLEAADEIGGDFQFLRRKQFQILDDGVERAHINQS